eukprot:g816.t1
MEGYEVEEEGVLETKGGGNDNSSVTNKPKQFGVSPNMRVYPPALDFIGVEFGPLYVMTLSVQNTDSKVRRVRIIPPKTNFFRVAYFPNTAVAPGLDVQFEVEFQAAVEKDYHDKITVISGDESIEVPLHAYLPAPNIEFDPFCDLGVVVLNSSATKYIEFMNSGHRPGDVEIECEDENFEISPLKFQLGPKGRFIDQDRDGRMEEDEWVDYPRDQWTSRVRVEFVGTEVGPVRGVARVKLKGRSGIRVLDINAEVVDQRLELVPIGGDGPSIEEIPFGTVYYGEKREVRSMLVNNGPNPVSFSFVDEEKKREGETDGDDLDEEENENSAKPPKPPETILIKPMEGMMKPYSSTEVVCTFAPIYVRPRFGFAADDERKGKIQPKLFSKKMLIVCGDTKQEIPLQLNGTASPPFVQLSERTLKFGECPIGERRDIVITVKNTSESLDVRFALNKVAHFQTQVRRGYLRPLQSQKVVVTFRPSQVGRFKTSMHLVINDGIATIPIRVQGTSSTKVEGASRITRSQFAGEPPLVPRPTLNMKISSKRKSKKFQRPMPWDPARLGSHSAAAISLREGNNGNVEGTADATYTFSISDLKEKHKHREKYNTFIDNMRQARLATEKRKELKRKGLSRVVITVEDPGVDLGMARRSGMPSPRLSIPDTVDELWLERPIDHQGKPKRGAGGGSSGMARKHDPHRLVKRKFKVKPSTQAEMQDCSSALEPQDLKAISCGPKSLNFGKVCVRSETTQSFSVYNDLNSNVFVALKLNDSDALAQSFPPSQVIPSGSTAGFDIVLCSTQEGKFKETVQYVINDNHTFKFNVVADVVPITIDFSKTEINFSFEPDNLDSSVTEMLALTNPGNAETEVRWILRNPAFQIEPSSAVIGPNETVDVAVTFTPTLRCKSEDSIELKISGGRSQQLFCRGVVEEARLGFKQKHNYIDFGEIAVGLAHQKQVTVKNGGKVPSVFWVSCSIPGVTISPERGRVLPGSTMNVTITLIAEQPRNYDSNTSLIIFNVRCGHSKNLGIKAKAVVPKILIQEDEFNFGEVAIGASVRQRITFLNKGNIPAAMILDFTKHPEFAVSQAPTPSVGQGGRPATSASVFTAIDSIRESGNDGTRSPDLFNDENNERENHIPRKFKLTIRPSAPLMLDIVFKPVQEAEHSFELPIALNGVEEMSELRRVVVAHGLSPKVILSSSVVDFGQVVVSRDRVKKVPHHLHLTLQNASDEVLQWEFDAGALKKALKVASDRLTGFKGRKASFSTETFTIDPVRGKIEPGETTKTKVTFLPEGANEIRVMVPLHIDNDFSRPYLEMEIKGRAVYPRLEFDQEEIILTPVPLGITSKSKFYVKNAGYENLEVKYHLPKDQSKMPLALEFPEGKQVSKTKASFPVIVSFQSKQPLSFTARIDFLDEEGNRFPIYVTGMTDNSLLSTYQFVQDVEDRKPVVLDPDSDNYASELSQLELDNTMSENSKWIFDISNSEAPVQFVQKKLDSDGSGGDGLSKDGKSGRKSPRSPNRSRSKSPKGRGKRGSAAQAERKEKEEISLQEWKQRNQTWQRSRRNFLLRWLNLNILKQPISEFPGTIVQENGLPIIEMIESLCSKQVPNKVKSGMTTERKRDALDALMKQYGSMLLLLKGFGALVHLVKPENLLSRTLFVKYRIQSLQEKGLLGSDATSPEAMQVRNKAENEFKKLSMDAWTQVVLQTIKIFMLSRIHLRQYENLPGVKGMDEDEMKNFFSNSELKDKAFKQERNELKESKKQKNNLKNNSKKKSRRTKKNKMRLDPTLTQSNIYSVPENILAKWVSFHFKNCNPDQEDRRIVNFETDLKDGVLLCSLLLSHAPHLADDKGGPMSELILRADAPGSPLSKSRKSFRNKNSRSHDDEKSDGTKTNPSGLSNEQRSINIESFLSGLSSLRLEYIPDKNDIMNPNGRDMILLLLSLYNTLPNYIPKTEIEFAGVLGQAMTKQIILKNPSKSAMRYQARIEGSPCYRTLGSNVTLEAREQAAVAIEFSSRFSQPARGQLILQSQRDGGISAATLVFNLVSRVTDHKPIRTVHVECGVYKNETVDIDISNPFGKTATFQITALQEMISSGEAYINSNSRRRKKNSRKTKSKFDEKRRKMLPNSFIIEKKDIRLNANSQSKLKLHFLPLSMGEYACKLIFLNEEIGEFVYEIIGTAHFPDTFEEIKFNTPLKPQCGRDIMIIPKNTLFEKAKDYYLDLLPGRLRSQTRDRFKQLSSFSSHFTIDVNSPFFTVPNEFEINNLAGKKSESQNQNAGNTRLGVTFSPKEPGIYPCKVIMCSLLDVRIYEIKATVTANAVEKVIDFIAPASKVITQSIPIKNNTDEKWMLKATFTGSSTFDGPGTLLVPAKSVANYDLTFSPTWVCKEDANLTLFNQPTGDTFSFRLNGIGEEPLAEDHVTIDCKARDTLTRTFQVRNRTNETVKFHVESDLAHVSGPSEIQVGPNGTGNYQLTIHPQLGGTYSGSITFKNLERDSFQWYTVEIRASPPDPEATVDISAVVRKAVAVEISLGNPTKEPVTFDVILRGEGLIGDSSFYLPPESEDQLYELIYSPLVAGKQHGSITFIDMELGEFWYKLELDAKAAAPIYLETMSCAVGKSIDKVIKLENPTGAQLTLKSKSTNKTNFQAIPAAVTLPPYGTADVKVRYSPSSLDAEKIEESIVTFSNKRVGEWVYHVKGRGEPPSTAMEPFVVTALVGHSTSTSFMFRNPFPESLTVTCEMEFDEKKFSKVGSFQLLVKRSKCVIPAFGNLQIPLMFCPYEISELNATVTLTSVITESSIATNYDGTPLKWVHPLRGIAEICPLAPKLKLRCRARQALQRQFHIQLPGLKELESPEKFKFEVKTLTNENDVLVKAALDIVPLKERLFNADEPLVYDVKFEPLRAFREAAEMVISKESGGRWRFKMLLDVLDPEVDDVIAIQATLGNTSSVSFDLANIDNSQANFKAFMSPDSPIEFQVYPSEGVLDKYGSQGTNFVVSFSPRDYGKILVGKLIIQTSEMMWSYEIRGSHPGYVKPPSPKGSIKMRGVRNEDGSISGERNLERKKKKRRDRKNLRMKKVEKEAFAR